MRAEEWENGKSKTMICHSMQLAKGINCKTQLVLWSGFVKGFEEEKCCRGAK